MLTQTPIQPIAPEPTIQPDPPTKQPKLWLWILLTILITATIVSLVTYFIVSSIVKNNLNQNNYTPTQESEEVTTNTIANTQTETEDTSDTNTQNWQTYTNNECGFQIKYPNTWQIDTNRSSNKEVVFNIENAVENRQSIGCESSNISLNEWLAKIDKNIIISTDNIKVDNKSALKVKTSEFGITRIAVQYQNKLYTITTSGETIINDGVLNTFKFIDNRISLTQSIFESLSNAEHCNAQFNNEEADEYVKYSNTTKGLLFSVPYNSNWGTAKYKIQPYDETSDEINFGRIGLAEGCSWFRTYILNFLSAKTAEQVISSIDSQGLSTFTPYKMQINGLEVVKYEASGLCPSYPTLQVIGKKYNYELTTTCGGDFADLEDIVKTVKLLD